VRATLSSWGFAVRGAEEKETSPVEAVLQAQVGTVFLLGILIRLPLIKRLSCRHR